MVVNGHVIRHLPGGAPRAQRPVLLRGRDGKFADWTARGGPYFQARHDDRGLVLADLDNDGKVDLVVSHLNAPVTVLRNVAPTAGNHWLGVDLRRPDHADMVGAKVTLEAGGRTQTRFAKGGGSYAGRIAGWCSGPRTAVTAMVTQCGRPTGGGRAGGRSVSRPDPVRGRSWREVGSGPEVGRICNPSRRHKDGLQIRPT